MIDAGHRKQGQQKLPRSRLGSILHAGREVLKCYQAREKNGSNVVEEVLRGQDTLNELSRYPADDVCDPESGGQYYYHWHRTNENENGYFLCFALSEKPEKIRYLSNIYRYFSDYPKHCLCKSI
jgi:hypothetical protein|tara:strand:- start:179 stop:550 length:372 start_codon:yes stop_codon:yes gene_type:complete